MIQKDGNGYKITESAKKILYPTDKNDNESKNLLVKAILKPTIFSELISQYKGVELPKEEFIKNNFRQKGIIENSLDAAVNSFMESLKYAGILKEDKIIIDEEIFSEITKNKKKEQTGKNTKRPNNEISSGKIRKIINSPPDELPETKNELEFDKEPFQESSNTDNIDQSNFFKIEIPFDSGKKAKVIIPKDCNRNDINLLITFVEAIKDNIK